MIKPSTILAIAAVAMASPVGYNVVRGHQEHIRLIETNIAQEQTTQEARMDVAAMLRQLDQYRTRLPSEPNPSELVADAVSLGERVGLQLTTIEQEPPQPLQQFTRLAVTFQFNTSYHQLGDFLDLIERSNRFMRVERLQVKSESSQTHSGVLAIQLTLSTVYVPPILKAEGK